MATDDSGSGQFAPWGRVSSELFACVSALLQQLELLYKETGIMEGTEPGNRYLLEDFSHYLLRFHDGIWADMDEDMQKALEAIRKLEDKILWNLLEFRREEMSYSY